MEQQTAVTILLQEHWRELGIDVGWGRSQVNKLCGMMKITPNELGALAAVRPGYMGRYMKDDKIPPPVALHFLIIQDWWVSRVTGIPAKPRIPVDMVA